ncbi:MAG: hypothetical protein WD757_03060 [Actinomycetota bacterium]
MSDRSTASSLEKVEAILTNPALYELALAIPAQRKGGRRRDHPVFMILVFNSLLSVWRSGRQVEAELSHPLIWKHMRRIVRDRFPEDTSMHLPKRAMRRHHYVYGRDRYLTDPAILEKLGAIHRELASGQARAIGLLDPEGQGSYTHPDLSRVLHADGKVVTPLFTAKPGDFRVDTETGEVLPIRYEADAALHFEGDGEAVWGTKFVMVATRSKIGRLILDIDRVPDPGSEAKTAVTCLERLAPHVPGAQAIVYDTALRGVHHQEILRELGIVPVNMVAAAETFGSRKTRGKIARREKLVHVEDKEIASADGSALTVRLFSKAGAIGIMRPTETGELRFIPLVRKRTHRMRAANGLYRWYNDYRLPEHLGGGQITVRLHQDNEDRKRKFNRTENVRPIPPSDPDFPRLYGRRNDSESLNRGLEDTLFLGRAHSLGWRRQQVEMIGWALMVNALTLARHRAAEGLQQAA